jgi:hypothetical protein
MTTNPIDMIADAIRNPEPIAPRNGHKESDHRWRARAVSYVLQDPQVVDNAVRAVREHTWTGDEMVSDRYLAAVVRVAFHSVGGGE